MTGKIAEWLKFPAGGREGAGAVKQFRKIGMKHQKNSWLRG
jgi:hypothetical protein